MLGRSKLTTWLMPSTVDAARGDIGGDQGFHVAPAKRREHALALTLRFVAVDRLGGDAGLGQLTHDLVGAVLGSGEDESAIDRAAPQDVDQRGGFCRAIDMDDA